MGNIRRPYYKHFVFEVKCTFDEANSVSWIENKVDTLLGVLKIKKFKSIYYQFDPQGISLVHILSASHIAIHSWPEDGYLQADFISCQKDINLQGLTTAVRQVFDGFEYKITELKY